MKKIISVDREITFTSMIHDISSICLDHTLKFVSSNKVEGDLIVSGTYKMTEASRLDEEFEVKIPVSISTSDNYVLDTTNVSIDDFTYEVINDDTLNVKIDLLLEGVEEVITVEEEKELVRECDGDGEEEKIKEVPLKIEKDKVVPVDYEEKKEEVEIESLEEVDDNEKVDTISNNESDISEIVEDISSDDNSNDKDSKSINSLFANLGDEDEEFSTYLVYIMRKNDSIEKVLETYDVTREELSSYNDLSSLEIGSKLIIPCKNE